MRIATWNVLGLTGYPAAAAADDIGHPGQDSNCDHFAGVFTRLDADVLALQEGVAHGVAQAVARRIGCHLATAPSPGAWPGHVLSRYAVRESRVFSHTLAGSDVPAFSRTAAATLLQVDSDAVWIVNVHLHPGDIELRQREGDILRQRLGELRQVCDNIVVLGDFNCDVDEAVHAHLRELGFLNAMAIAGGGVQRTMDTAGVREWRIDHIYLSPGLGPSLTTAHVERGAGFRTDAPRPDEVWDHSDHLPVLCELAWST